MATFATQRLISAKIETLDILKPSTRPRLAGSISAVERG